MVFSKSLTTKEVARLCRVSDATVKRWEEAGVLQSERTNGGHRRFRAAEVARFQRAQNPGTKISNGGKPSVKTKSRNEISLPSGSSLFHSLIIGDEEEVADFMIGAFLHGTTLTKLFDEMLCPAMHQIGNLWFKGELTVAQEHLATRTAHNAIFRLRQLLPIPETSGKLAMCCGVEGDFHELPTCLAQTTMENSGWEVVNFGANMPLYSLAEEAVRNLPGVICISATILTDIERFVRDYKEFRERISKHKTQVIIGGRAFCDEEVRRRIPAENYAVSFSEVSNFLQTIIH